MNSGKSLITTKAAEDVTGSEAHARTMLQAWLDSRLAGEDMVTFKGRHSEAAGKMTADTTWALVSAQSAGAVRDRERRTQAERVPVHHHGGHRKPEHAGDEGAVLRRV